MLAFRAGSANTIPVNAPTPSVFVDSVAVVESEDTARITVPGAKCPPESVSAIGRPMSPALKAAVDEVNMLVPPVVAPFRKKANEASLLGSRNPMPLPAAATPGDTVTLVRLFTAVMTALAARCPPPSVSRIGWPRSLRVKFAELEVKVAGALAFPSVKLAGGVTRLGSANLIEVPALAAAESVTELALLTAVIVVPPTTWPPPSISMMNWFRSEATNTAVEDVKVVVPLATPSP